MLQTTPHSNEPTRQGNEIEGNLPLSYERGALTKALKARTKAAHESVEKGTVVNQILGGDIELVPAEILQAEQPSREETEALDEAREIYSKVVVAALKAVYGFERALEKQLDESPLGQQCIELGLIDPNLRASELIKADLEMLGEDLPSKLMALPNFDSIAQAVGALYVRQGSRMGGMQIAAHIRKTGAFDADTPFTFFPASVSGEELKAYVHQTKGRFNAFLRAADHAVQEGNDIRAAVSMANDVFRCVGDWQREYYSNVLPEFSTPEAAPTIGSRVKSVFSWFVQDD